MNNLEKRTESECAWAKSWADADPVDRRRRAGRAVRDGDIETLRDLLAAFLRGESNRQSISDHTLTAYGRAISNGQGTGLMDWTSAKPHKLTSTDAQNYRAFLEREPVAYSVKTVNLYLTGARRFVDALQWAGLSLENGQNPFRGVTVRDMSDPKDKADPYTVQELNDLLEAADERERVIVLLAADGGLRLSQIASLEWSDVNPQRRRLAVQEGRGGKTRTIRITQRLMAALDNLGGVSGRVVGVGMPRIKQIVTALCERAGVNPRGTHNLRHTCGTRLYEETRDLQAVARHLGHSATRASELYAHVADTDYEAAVDALDGNSVERLHAC